MRGIAILIHDLDNRWGWAVSATPLPLYLWERDIVPIVQEPGPASEASWDGYVDISSKKKRETHAEAALCGGCRALSDWSLRHMQL